MNRALFKLGKIYATPGAIEALKESGQEAEDFLARHQRGEWGDLCSQDWKANDQAVLQKTRIFSVYHTERGIKIWVITEWDRSATTLLLPQDY